MPWAKGETGNPRGRPRHSVREELRRQAAKKRPDGTTNVQAVARTAFALATGGSMKAIEFVTEQLDGKVPSGLALTGADGGPVVFTILFTGQHEDADGDL